MIGRSVNIDLLEAQEDFFFSEYLHSAFIGGLGSGKSHVATAKLINKKLKYKGIPVAYYLPTYPLIKDIAFEKIASQLDAWEIHHKLRETDKEFILRDYGKIIMRSMDNPETIVGYEVGYSLIDEADILPQEKMQKAFIKIIARNRAKLPKGELNCTDVVSTPEGFCWVWNFFVKNAKPNRVMFKAKTEDNPFLPDEYVETLRDSYTDEQLDAYLNGDFVNLTSGGVYSKYFSRTIHHSGRVVQDKDILHIGMDFNVTNMSAVVHVVDNDTPIAVGEITKAYDTDDMIRIINDRYSGHKIVVYPDASGQNKKTSGKSDVKMLKEAGFTVRVLTKNPPVKDRINAMNRAFKDKNGDAKYFINTNECIDYVEALEQIVWKNGEPDKSSGFDHVTDAGGYFIYQNKKNNSSWGKSSL